MLSSLRTIAGCLWIVNLNQVFASDTLNTGETTHREWVPGALVFCKKLKGQKQEEKKRLNKRVEKISNSFAVILDPPTNPQGSSEGDRVNIEWLGDGSSTVKIGVKSKYLRPIPHLYIHSLENYGSALLKRYKLRPALLTKLILKDHTQDSIELIHFTSNERRVVEMRHNYVRQMRDKSGRTFDQRITASDLCLLHLIEEWYDGKSNSHLDIHVAVSTKMDALNKENLMRLCTIMYQENLYKRTSFGRYCESGDIHIIRRVLQRQVLFVVHSQPEMDEQKMACVGPVLLSFISLNVAVGCLTYIWGLNQVWGVYFLSPMLFEAFTFIVGHSSIFGVF